METRPLDDEAVAMIAEIESQQRALQTALNVLASYLRKREGLDESWQLAANRREFVHADGANAHADGTGVQSNGKGEAT